METRKETIRGLLNGFYKLTFKGEPEMITEYILKLPDKINDPFVRAMMSYGYLNTQAAYSILVKTFNVYKKWCGNITSSELLFEVLVESEEIKQDIPTEERSYASVMLSAFYDEIKAEYEVKTERKAS